MSREDAGLLWRPFLKGLVKTMSVQGQVSFFEHTLVESTLCGSGEVKDFCDCPDLFRIGTPRATS